MSDAVLECERIILPSREMIIRSLNRVESDNPSLFIITSNFVGKTIGNSQIRIDFCLGLSKYTLICEIPYFLENEGNRTIQSSLQRFFFSKLFDKETW